MLISNIFHTNPLNLPKFQTAVETHSSMFGASNLLTFIVLTCPFHFWHLFSTTTIFYDGQGNLTLSCKEPILAAFLASC